MSEDKVGKFFKVLFDANEHVYTGSLYEGVITSLPSKSGPLFYTVNPIHPRLDFDYKKKPDYEEFKPRRADMNVTCFRNFIFEFDTIPILKQKFLINKLKLPISAIVFSGGKSLHLIMSLEDAVKQGCHTMSGINQYKETWTRIANYINEQAKSILKVSEDVVDCSTKNPSRLTRFPNSYRVDKNAYQKLLFLGKRINKDEFSNLLQKCPVVESIKAKKVASGSEVQTETQFWALASIGLKNQLKYVDWGASSGMYPILYKLTLWAIDDTGIDKDTFLSILRKVTFPQLEKCGYPEEKFEVAVNHAYAEKGL